MITATFLCNEALKLGMNPKVCMTFDWDAMAQAINNSISEGPK